MKIGIDPRKMTLAIKFASYLSFIFSVTLGGMHHNAQLCKGVKSDHIPQPNPQNVELPKKSLFNDSLSHAKALYFEEYADKAK